MLLTLQQSIVGPAQCKGSKLEYILKHNNQTIWYIQLLLGVILLLI